MSLARGDWFFILLVFLDCIFMVRPYVYEIQQDNYRISEIFKSRRLTAVYLIDLLTVVVFVIIWTIFYFVQAKIFWGFATAMFFFITEFALYFMEDLPSKKKPLKYTKRAVRAMLAVSVVCAGAISAAIAVMNVHLHDVYMRYLIFFGFPLVFPLFFIVTVSAVNVFERLNNLRYEKRSRKILANRPDLIKIAITGSYGKTSVKNILAEILSEQYNVLSTPASYNTPMGISKTLRSLDATHEVLIAEMGARRVGDIRKLMKIIEPSHTIVTGVNLQHLATFKSAENILREKTKALSMLKGDGFAVMSDTVRERYEGRINKKQSYVVPIYTGFDENSDVRISDVDVTDEGSVFTLSFEGVEYRWNTPLLGRHNIENIALAAAMALGLGVRPERVEKAVERLAPVPHRMQLIEGNGIRIIDDSFNSNPDGARCSLEVLDMFKGRKVVVTPGLVELGESEYEENYKLGKRIGETADVVMLIGQKRSEPLRRALRDSDYGGEVRVYASLSDAEADFGKVLHLNDVLLLLNDLPDCYNE